MENHLEALLSASSLLLAVVGVLYGLWYGEINKAIALPVSQPENNEPAFNEASAALWSRAVPLAAMAASLGLIFLPDAWKIACDSWSLVRTHGIPPARYDAVRTAFCLVVVISLLIGAYTMELTIRLAHHRSKLTPRTPS